MSNGRISISRTVSIGNACVVAAALAATCAPQALALRAATATERRDIVRAVKGSVTPEARGRFVVRDYRISTVSTPGRRYGAVALVPKPGTNGQGANAILRRLGSGRWRVLDTGGDEVGCHSNVPARVLRDLKLPRCT